MTEMGVTKEQADNIAELTELVSDEMKPLLRLCAVVSIGADDPRWAEYALTIVRSAK